ncbi:MAG: DUF1311 domain-containing protein [Deltaproteobacteria bacterium]|nr:DUF1311 domain-containing protein [Deltaproteobacteria bacterium]
MRFYFGRTATLTFFVWCSVLIVDYHNATGADCDTAKTTKDIVECEDLQLKNATRTLSDLHKQLNRVLTMKQRKALEKAHAAWLSYREEHCDSAALLYEGGTMETIVSVTCFAEMTKERVKQLRAAFKLWLTAPKP